MTRTLEQIWADVPSVACKGLCQNSCGPIMMSRIEARRILGKHASLPSMLPNLSCDKLSNGRCSIYADRPLICRLWGAVRKMRCQHGCTPNNFLSDKQAYGLLDEMNRLP